MSDPRKVRMKIASPKEAKDRLIAAARGEAPPATADGKLWIAPEAFVRLAARQSRLVAEATSEEELAFLDKLRDHTEKRG